MDRTDVNKYIKNNSLKIIVKPSSHANKIVKFDDERDALKVEIKAPPEKGKANIEVIKFFSKLTGKKAKIAKGMKSKEKTIAFS